MLGALLTLSLLAVAGLVGLGIWAEVRRQSIPDLLKAWNAPRAANRPPSTWLTWALWLTLVIPLLDHLSHPRSGLTAQIIWALTIIPHEAGHLICNPFGLLLMFLGGSIWQVLLWALLGAFYTWVRRKPAQALLSWMIAGHSCINVAVYMRDAQERNLPLLFALGPENHDWWNILSRLGLLRYDNLLADMTSTLGAIIVLACIAWGLWRA
jgi:hypothetical protein